MTVRHRSPRRLASDLSARVGQDLRALGTLLRHPLAAYRVLRQVSALVHAEQFAARLTHQAGVESSDPVRDRQANPLWLAFEAHREGPGIFKWQHYFEIYHRHLARFIGRRPHIVEIGVYAGGSLSMWRDYFGPGTQVTGVDILESCRGAEGPEIRVVVGDQADRDFWRRFRSELPAPDIVIDDGGHTPRQQRVTLEELLPALRPGGVFLCEDILGSDNEFAAYIAALSAALNVPHLAQMHQVGSNFQWPVTAWQDQVASVHRYPYVAVIERTDRPIGMLQTVRRGSVWMSY